MGLEDEEDLDFDFVGLKIWTCMGRGLDLGKGLEVRLEGLRRIASVQCARLCPCP